MIELAGILILGIFAQWLAWKVKIPAILPLILIGLLIGPFSTLITPGNEKLLEGDKIFSGDFLFSFVALSVGVILFEGGLTLRLSEIKNLISPVRNLLSIGTAVTFIGGGLAAWWILDLDYRLAFLFGALIIVSGPTVVAPILRNVRPNQKVNAILKWEGILIDPLGALIAVLVFEFIRFSHPEQAYTVVALRNFFITIAAGFFAGVAGAIVLYYFLRRDRLPGYLRNVAALALVILTFAFAEILQRESGLLAAVVMGMVLANLKMQEIKNILPFKEDISLILVSVLFILLSSRIDMDQIMKLGYGSLILFGVVILVLRPLGVILSTINSNLTWKEKLFVSWVGPKGIVAAAVASLFSLELAHRTGTGAAIPHAPLLLPLTFLMIVGTVILQGGTAKPLAKILGLVKKEPQGILFVGANEASRFLAKYLKSQGIPVLLADTARSNLAEVKEMNIPVFEGSILREEALEWIDLASIGRLFALTSNNEINMLACKRFRKELGEENIYRLVTKRESELKNIEMPKNLLFKGKTDFINFIQRIRKDPEILEKKFSNESEFREYWGKNKEQIIPMFVKTPDKKIRVISGFEFTIGKGDTLVFIEKEKQPVQPDTGKKS